MLCMRASHYENSTKTQLNRLMKTIGQQIETHSFCGSGLLNISTMELHTSL